jgi:hypothetical protein
MAQHKNMLPQTNGQREAIYKSYVRKLLFNSVGFAAPPPYFNRKMELPDG